MKRAVKPPPDQERQQEGSESNVDLELERRSRARDRRRSRGSGAHKQRLVWHPEMHAAFEAAVAALGGAFCATPKAILEHMGGEGTSASLTLANVKSHLQKYRVKEQKRREEEAEEVGRSSASLAAALAVAGSACHSGGTAGAVPPVAAVLHASPNVPTLSPGAVPINAIGSGPQTPLELLPPLQLPATSARSAAVTSPAGLNLPPHNVATPPLAVEQAGEEVPFADERLGQQAEAWRCKQQVLAAQAAALQVVPGPPSQPQQLALILLQRENLKCLQALHVLHLEQMQQHLDAAARLKEQVDAPGVEVKQEHKPSEEVLLNVLAAACMGGISGSPGDSSELGSPCEGADAPVGPMEE